MSSTTMSHAPMRAESATAESRCDELGEVIEAACRIRSAGI